MSKILVLAMSLVILVCSVFDKLRGGGDHEGALAVRAVAELEDAQGSFVGVTFSEAG